MNTPPGLSIIVPVYNEEHTIEALIQRIADSLESSHTPYEIIFVDDHSKDATKQKIQNLVKKHPIQLFTKEGKRGKAYSIVQGATHVRYEYIAMIDADLQYPPEVLPALFTIAQEKGMAVAFRKTYRTTFLRRIASRFNAFLFGRLLLGLNTDVQSGLKIFKREIFEHLNSRLVSAWAIDIPLLFTGYELGYTIGRVDIDFRPRISGQSHVQLFETAKQIATGAIKTRFSHRRIFSLPANAKDTMRGAGIAYKRQRFITHTTLPHHISALTTLTRWQKIFLGLLLVLVGFYLLTNPLTTGIIMVGILSAIYFIDVLFNLYLILKSLHFPPEISIDVQKLEDLKSSNLPIYSILCPLYREAKILPQFIEAMKALDWPKEKLDILLLLEEDDTSTIDAARTMKLPSSMRIVIVPHSEPKTKPKASNYGLAMAKGAYVVVYDAEDIPDPLQLKKAYLGFQQLPASVVCLQAKLNYYNPHHNLLTRLFTAEYSLWFDVVLPGLQSINTTIPLGGTSNHFRTKDLQKLQGWDPFNVTEDCDLGARLFKQGYKTAIIDSTTLEEANSRVKNWFRQRSRWIKGYMQTYFVHMRNPMAFAKTHGIHALIFQLVVGGRIAFMLINPFLWLATISYFALYTIVGPAIEAMYPSVIFYMAAFSLVFGNFIYLYNYMIGCAKRGHWELIKYVFFIPFYWLMISVGAGIALFQLMFKPHYWEKTVHGLHFDYQEKQKEKELMHIQSAQIRAHRLQRLADLASSDIVSGGILVTASMIGNLLNFFYNAYLGRAVNIEDFGIISLIGSFIYVSQIPFNALSRAVTHKSAYLFGKYNTPVKEFWQSVRKRSYLLSVGIGFAWVAISPILQIYFKTNSILPFILFTPVWVIGALSAVDGGFLGGNLRFRMLATLIVIEGITKIVFTIGFIKLGFADFVYAAIPLSMLISFTVRWWHIQRISAKHEIIENLHAAIRFPRTFFATSILTSLTSVAYLSLDLVLAKHYLTPTDAGNYSFLTLVGKMVYFVGSLFSQFIVPVISREIGAGRNHRHIFIKLLAGITLVNLAGFVVFGIFGSVTAPILWGPKIAGIVYLLPMYTFAMMCFSISSAIISYHQTKKEYFFPVAGFILGIGELVGIVVFHNSIQSITEIVTTMGFVSLIAIVILDRLYGTLVAIFRNSLDFLGLFGRLPEINKLPDNKLRILIFNWRDLRHKWAGGAEVYIHELSKRWVTMGHEVTIFSGNDGESDRYETIDGVRMIRRGGTYFVYIWAFLYYLLRLKGKYDVIIDSENGIPFFSPFYAKEKVYLLIHHVHQEVFRKGLKPPLSWIGMFLERRLMPIVYRNTEVVTISPSSKADILAHKLTKKDPHVVYCGVDFTICKPGKKNPTPLVLYLGRLTTLKSLSVFIQSAKKIVAQIPHVQFIIAGDGPDKKRLMKIVKSLGLEQVISFIGKVSDAQKIALYQKAWVFVNPSLIEGWGITTIEANACGTPVVASNVAGLRDAVHNPHSGLLVPYGNIEEFSLAIAKLIENRTMRTKMSKEAIEWAKKFDWEKSAQKSIDILNV